MRWASAHSALAERRGGRGGGRRRRCATTLGEGAIDLCVAVRLGGATWPAAEGIAASLRERSRRARLAARQRARRGDADHEIEQGPALSLIAARLPGVEVKPFLLLQESWGRPIEDEAAFDLRAPGARDAELVVLLGDPFSIDVERVLALVQPLRAAACAWSAASRAQAPGPARTSLLLNDWMSPEGAVAIALHGAIARGRGRVAGLRAHRPAARRHARRGEPGADAGRPTGRSSASSRCSARLPESERGRLRQGLYVGRPVRGDAGGAAATT